MQEFDCLTCGACCSSAINKVVVFKVEFDETKFSHGKHIEKFTVLEGEDHKMKFTADGKCIALDGKVGECVSCTIYENRPFVCRTFEVGGSMCKKLRNDVLKIK